MSEVLVTGASGLFGRRIAPLLRAHGWDVMTTGRHDPDYPADITRPGNLASLVESLRPDAIVHLAGGATTPKANAWELNLLPSVELLHAALRSPKRPRVILMGSAAEYGLNGSCVKEDTPAHPVTDYGRAKYVQTICASRFRETGMEVLVLRPFNVVAPDLPPSNSLGNLRAQVMANWPARTCKIRCGRLDVVRDFVTADFVAQVVTRCLSDWPKAPELNVASGNGITLRHVFDAFAKQLDMEFEYLIDQGLSSIPAPDMLTGDPTALEVATTLRCNLDAADLARALVGLAGSESAHGEVR